MASSSRPGRKAAASAFGVSRPGRNSRPSAGTTGRSPQWHSARITASSPRPALPTGTSTSPPSPRFPRFPPPPPAYTFEPARKLPDAAELAKRPSPIDALKQDSLPPGVAAVLGDTRFRLPKTGPSSWMVHDREGKFLAVPNVDGVALFDLR